MGRRGCKSNVRSIESESMERVHPPFLNHGA